MSHDTYFMGHKNFFVWLEQTHPDFEMNENWMKRALAAGTMMAGMSGAMGQEMPQVPKLYKPGEQIVLASHAYDDLGKKIDMSVKEIGPNHIEVGVFAGKDIDKAEMNAKSQVAKALGKADLNISQFRLDRSVKTSSGSVINYYRMVVAGENQGLAPSRTPDKTIPNKRIIIDD